MSCSLDKVFVRDFERNDSTVLHINQCETGDVGCVVWDAAIVLTSYLDCESFTKKHLVKNTRVVELGSGTGICGLQAACLGAQVTLTDLAEFVPLLNLNITANKSLFTGSAKAQELKWGEEIQQDLLEPDYILIADCVYYNEAVSELVKSINDLAAKNTTVICCYEERTIGNKHLMQEKFFQLIGETFLIKKISLEDQDPVYRSEDIHLYHFNLK